MNKLLITLLLTVMLFSTTTYAETELVDVFYKTYKEHDNRRDDVRDHYIYIIELGNKSEEELTVYGEKQEQSDYKKELPDWFIQATLEYKKFGSSKDDYIAAINKLLSNEYLRSLDTEDGNYVANVVLNIKPICNILTTWSVDECIDDLNNVQTKLNDNAQAKIEQINNARQAKILAKQEAIENKKAKEQQAFNSSNPVDAYKAIHKKYNYPQVKQLVELADDDNGWSGNLVYQQGLTWPQAKDVIEFVVNNVNSCWLNTVINKATNDQLNGINKSYINGKTQFINKKYPVLPTSLKTCSLKSGQFIKQRINYIIANN